MIYTNRLVITPLNYDQLLKYIKGDGSLEKELNVAPYSRTISAELKEAFEKTILPNVKTADENYLFSTLWTAILLDKKQMVADLCMIDKLYQKGEIEIGYGTYKEFQNNGYMTEIVGGIIKWAKEQPKVLCVSASTEKSNIASYKVLENNGFVNFSESDQLLHWQLKIHS